MFKIFISFVFRKQFNTFYSSISIFSLLHLHNLLPILHRVGLTLTTDHKTLLQISTNLIVVFEITGNPAPNPQYFIPKNVEKAEKPYETI